MIPASHAVTPLVRGLMAVFILLLAINVWHHVPWSDELHAWGLALHSATLADLFRNLHFEGHPGLWHLILWVASSLTTNLMVMQVVHAAMAAAVILILGLWAPFRPIEKALLFANYFLVFEYSVVARNYGVALLLALLYVRMRCADRSRPWAVALVLGAMGNANVYAFVLSGLLALEFLHHRLLGPRPPQRSDWPGLAGAAGLYAVLMLVSVATLWPDPAISSYAQQPDALARRDPARLVVQTLRAIVAPFLPIDFSFPASFAFPGNIYAQGKRVWLCAALAPAILFALWRIFRPRWDLLGLILGCMAVTAGFSFLVYPAAIRHMGIVFIAFVCALWIMRADSGQLRPSLPVLALLAMGALGGAVAQAGQWMRPYAVNQQVVDWLLAHDLGDAPIIGFPDIRIEAVALLMDRPFYALECQCEARYVRLDNRRNDFRRRTVPDRLATAMRRYGPGPVVFLAGDPVDPAEREAIARLGLRLEERVHLAGAERDIQMTIFTVTGMPAPAAPGGR